MPRGIRHLQQAHRAKPGALRAAQGLPSDAPETPASLPRGRGRRKLSFGLGAVLASALGAVVVVSAGLIPLALSREPVPVAGIGAHSGGSPLPAVGTYVLPPPTPTPGRSVVPVPDSTFSLYQVAAGDNLTRIARDFGLSVTTLYWANSSAVPNPDLVKIGQKLLIPPMDGVVMKAGDGDTVETIADDQEIDPQVIIDANLLKGTTLASGQLLILPGVPNKPMPHPVSAPRPEDWRNKLEWPVPGHHTITQKFGCTTFYLEPPFGNCKHWHNGLDIGGARIGTPVVAAAGGTVIYAGRKKTGADGAGGGIVVWISHKGTLYTTYNHLNSVTVKAGQKVAAGQQVGTIGNTGASEGAHLHFEVWIDYPWTGKSMADAVDPLLYTAWKPSS